LNIIRIIIELVFVFAAQLTLANLIAIGGYAPDFIMIYLILRSHLFTSYQFIGGGFLAGLLQDLLGGGFLGLNALAKTITAFVLVKTFSQKKPENSVLAFGGVALCIFAHDFVFQYIYGQSAYFGMFPFIFRRVIPVFFYNFVIYLIISLLPGQKRRMI